MESLRPLLRSPFFRSPFLRSLSLAALLGTPIGAAKAEAGPDAGCRRQAMARLTAASPDGIAIYRQTSQRAFFESWIDCRDRQFDLPTAVHESAHFVAAETDAFPLVGGGTVDRPHEVSGFFPPSAIADRFAPDDFVSTYLRPGRASSSSDFLYLLDEFNAYSHDLETAVDLRAMRAPDEVVDHRDGLAAMMAFVTTYAETARTSEPETWRGLHRAPARATIIALWTRAERVMASSCGIPNYGTTDKGYLARVCAADAGSALATILGRAPLCPTACLAPDPATDEMPTGSLPDDEADGGTDIESDQAGAIAKRPRHPFAEAAEPRRHGPVSGN